MGYRSRWRRPRKSSRNGATGATTGTVPRGHIRARRALALVRGLLEGTPDRTLPAAPALKREHVVRFRDLLTMAEKEVEEGRVTLARAFEIALAIEGSESEDLVLDLLQVLKRQSERERAVRMLIHNLGDLSYMIEKYGDTKALLAEADRRIAGLAARLVGWPAVVVALLAPPAQAATWSETGDAGDHGRTLSP